MKTKFLSIALSCFMFFTVAYAVSSSFFLFAKDVDAQACNNGQGVCIVTGCPAGNVASTDVPNCGNAFIPCCTAPTAVTQPNGCPSGTCLQGGCGGLTPLGLCTGPEAGKTCCSSQPAPTISPTAFVCDASVFSGGLVQCGKGNSPEDCTFEAFICLLRRIMNFLLFVLAVPIAAISFAWAGWLYLSAAGNESKVKQAHEIFGTVALGLCLALAAWLIVHAIVLGLGVDSQYNFLGN